jgi:hypothetical protein
MPCLASYRRTATEGDGSAQPMNSRINLILESRKSMLHVPKLDGDIVLHDPSAPAMVFRRVFLATGVFL